MSHFCLLVVGENWKEQLEPFNEQTEDPRYKVFEDYTEDVLKRFANDTLPRVVDTEGKGHWPYEDRFRNPEYKMFSEVKPEWVYPEGWVVKEIPAKEIYATPEEFNADYLEYEVHEGKFGYWNNPNRKWDWYQMGGRYRGRFVLKRGAPGIVATRGSYGWGGEEDKPLAIGICDQAQVGDLDWTAMRAKRRSERSALWEEAFAKYPGDKEAGWRNLAFGIEPGMSYTEYVDDANEFSVFAVLKDGKWYEKGTVGWWGMVSDEKDDTTWQTELKKLLDTLDPEETVTIVDCHI